LDDFRNAALLGNQLAGDSEEGEREAQDFSRPIPGKVSSF